MELNFIIRIFCILLLIIRIKYTHSWIIRPESIINTQNPTAYNMSLNAKKKSGRVLITLECTEARKLGMPPSRYYTNKNKVNNPERLELMKYNKYLRRHTLHKEIK